MEKGDKAASEGNPVLALDYYSRAINEKPDSPAFYLTRGFLLLKLNRAEEALNDLGAYIKILPDSPQGYMSRGMIYSQLRRQKEADEDFDRACRLGYTSGCSFGGIIKKQE